MFYCTARQVQTQLPAVTRAGRFSTEKSQSTLAPCMAEGKSNFEFQCNPKATEYQHIKLVSIPGTSRCSRM